MSAAVAVAACPLCQGSGHALARTHLRLVEALAALPHTHNTVYNKRQKNAWQWLTHTGPDGHLTNELWVLVGEAAAWWIARGQPCVAHNLLALASSTPK